MQPQVNEIIRGGVGFSASAVVIIVLIVWLEVGPPFPTEWLVPLITALGTVFTAGIRLALGKPIDPNERVNPEEPKE